MSQKQIELHPKIIFYIVGEEWQVHSLCRDKSHPTEQRTELKSRVFTEILGLGGSDYFPTLRILVENKKMKMSVKNWSRLSLRKLS